MGFCYLPPEIVKMGQGSKWAKGQNGPRILWLKPAVTTIESNWAKRSQLGLVQVEPGPF